MTVGATTITDRDTLRVPNERGDRLFDERSGALELGPGARVRCAPRAAEAPTARESLAVVIDEPALVRVVEHGTVGPTLAYRLTYDLFQTGNVHLYARLEALSATDVGELDLPLITVDEPTVALREIDAPARPRIAIGKNGSSSLAVVVKKFPWLARWNDVGCYGHGVLASSRLDVRSEEHEVSLRVPGEVKLEAGETIEAALFLRWEDDGSALREGAYDHPAELRYIPEGEYLHSLVWEAEDVWLGPPILEGCPQRPADQLIPRPLGLDVLARKRFTWNNEDFSLWRLTGKDRYWESGIKKAYALLATQNEHGGWFEGIEFYNLAPAHHQMYDTYIAGLFLLEAYDVTGNDSFLEAAHRAKRFWTSESPPANGHTEEGPDRWWYRWGGYINVFGYTDERRVLNTHAGATEFLALLYERTGDAEARRGMENGIAAFKWGLERGIQKGNGQFLYCLSQVDPTLERPGDPPYVQLGLVPQIEDVYTIASSYRLMMANRIMRDEAVSDAIRRALNYWWTGYKEGTVYTYRAYAVIAFGVAAGELDLTYALALPTLLKNREHFTSMQRGLTSFVAPANLPGLRVAVRAGGSTLAEPIFVRRLDSEYTFALVNLEFAQRDLPLEIELPEGVAATEVTEIDPATGKEQARTFDQAGRVTSVSIPAIGEFGVTVIRVRF